MKYLYLILLPVTLLLPAVTVGQSAFVDKGVNAFGVMVNYGTTGGTNRNDDASVGGITLGFASKGVVDVGGSIAWPLTSKSDNNYGVGVYATVYPVKASRMGIPLSLAAGVAYASIGDDREHSLDLIVSYEVNLIGNLFIQPTIGGSFVDFGSEDARGRYPVGLPIYFASHPNSTFALSVSASFSQEIAPVYSFGVGLVIGKSKMQVN